MSSKFNIKHTIIFITKENCFYSLKTFLAVAIENYKVELPEL